MFKMTILKEYRINNELGQKEMADKLNCSIASYRLYEKGKKTMSRDVIKEFLKLRAYPSDLELVKVLESFEGK
jgi:transcriptional regulator with XRE-family HTH domain